MALNTFAWWQVAKCQNLAFGAKLTLFSDPTTYNLASYTPDPEAESLEGLFDQTSMHMAMHVQFCMRTVH